MASRSRAQSTTAGMLVGALSISALNFCLFGIVGCSSVPKRSAGPDHQVIQQSEDGREAFQEGDIQSAKKKYRKALLRAWAIDDPFESGTAAYNYAACLVSCEQYQEAEHWLVDSRCDLSRAKVSTGNAWLLSAQIAMAQCRHEDARRFIDYASCASAPCDLDESACLRGPLARFDDSDCKEPCFSRIPWIGERVKKKKAEQDCQQSYSAKIELSRARLAAIQFDVCTARKHLQAACAQSSDLCDWSLQADRHDVAAMIFDLEENFLQAGAHRDCEVVQLRRVPEYREIPKVLLAAACSYSQAGYEDIAVDRIIRASRILLARGQLRDAWECLRTASERASECTCEANLVRMELTAKWIDEALAPCAEGASSVTIEAAPPGDSNPPLVVPAPAE